MWIIIAFSQVEAIEKILCIFSPFINHHLSLSFNNKIPQPPRLAWFEGIIVRDGIWGMEIQNILFGLWVLKSIWGSNHIISWVREVIRVRCTAHCYSYSLYQVWHEMTNVQSDIMRSPQAEPQTVGEAVASHWLERVCSPRSFDLLRVFPCVWWWRWCEPIVVARHQTYQLQVETSIKARHITSYNPT